MSKGILITLEGLDGSGKTSIAKETTRLLKAEYGLDITLLSEPGTTIIGQEIRKILHDSRHENFSPRAEALLYQASRAQLVDEVINPLLAERKIILMDRFYDSSAAYQGEGRNLGRQEINNLSLFATGGIVPDLTVLLDIPVTLMKERLSGEREINRMDQQPEEFYEKVRQAYWQMARENVDGRWRVVNAAKSFDEVSTQVYDIVSEFVLERKSVEGQFISSEREN